jgi:putative spermidine/putrescine transport system permease protein
MGEARGLSFYLLGTFFAAYVLFLYGPMIAIVVLSFQGPDGGLTFPMNGLSFHWFSSLWQGVGVVDIWAAFGRSLRLGLTVTVLTAVVSVLAGLAFRRKFRGSTLLFYTAVASLIVPSIVVSLGIALEFRIFDGAIKATGLLGKTFASSMGLFTSALGAHLSWTLPFGLLIMFAVFNRFNPAYEEAARDLGASPWQTFRHVVLPLIAPPLIGVALFGFTLSWDELARTSQGHRRAKYAAARTSGPDANSDHTGALRAWHAHDGHLARHHPDVARPRSMDPPSARAAWVGRGQGARLRP